MADKPAITQPEAKVIKFMGTEAKQTVRPRDGRITVAVGTSEYRKMLEDKGVTEAVIKTVGNACRDILKDAVKAASDISLKNKGAQVRVKLGSNDLAQDVVFTSKHEVNARNPTTGEAIHKVSYGDVDATLQFSYGAGLKDDIAKIGEEHCAFWEKKAKK